MELVKALLKITSRVSKKSFRSFLLSKPIHMNHIQVLSTLSSMQIQIQGHNIKHNISFNIKTSQDIWLHYDLIFG